MKKVFIGATVTIIACAILASAPFLFMNWATGNALPTVLPTLESDTLYYLQYFPH